MKITFIYTSSSFEDILNIKGIENIFTLSERPVDFMELTKDKLEDLAAYCNKSDVLLCYGETAFRRVLNQTKSNKLIFFLLPAKEIINSYSSLWKKAGHTIVLKNDLDLEILLPDEATTYIEVYPKITTKIHSSSQSFSILFVEPDLHPQHNNLLSLIRVANQLSTMPNVKVTILMRATVRKQLFNKKIDMLTAKSYMHFMDALTENIGNASLVIGNSFPAYTAVLAGIPTIVHGNNGYGGIVTEELIKAFFLSNFQGRLGGEINETIPLPKILDDIFEIINNAENISQKNNCPEQLLTFQQISNARFFSKIEILYERFISNRISFQGHEDTYKTSSMVSVWKQDDENYLIKETSTGKILFETGKIESDLLQFLMEPKCIDEIRKEFEFIEETELDGFLGTLETNKILFLV